MIKRKKRTGKHLAQRQQLNSFDRVVGKVASVNCCSDILHLHIAGSILALFSLSLSFLHYSTSEQDYC